MNRILILLFALFLSACGNKQNHDVFWQTQKSAESGSFFTVEEVLQTSKYTYFKVVEMNHTLWYAISKMDAHVGDKFYYGTALKMSNFHSEELDRDFETIFFIDKVSKTPINASGGTLSASSMGSHPPMGTASSPDAMQEHQGKPVLQQNNGIAINKTKSEISIAQIFAAPGNFENKEIILRGIVVKVNRNVMGKNWIHLQDGTSFEGKFDLTVTSQTAPELDKEVSIVGILRVNKDFGAGYKYDVIVEDAIVLADSE